MPKLFLSARDDDTVPLAATRRLYAGVPGPKRLLTYPGDRHALGLLEGPDAERFTSDDRRLPGRAALLPADRRGPCRSA